MFAVFRYAIASGMSKRSRCEPSGMDTRASMRVQLDLTYAIAVGTLVLA